MTTTAAPTVKDHKILSLGLVESASVNSISDFTQSKLNESKVATEKEKEVFTNVFICHLIFYLVFCITLVFYILFDLGLGYFIRNKFIQLIGMRKNTIFEKPLPSPI
tara:strand:+ start:779 stop:1099 length:321 start_codon:yes stop_codon:yes gene_type:complete